MGLEIRALYRKILMGAVVEEVRTVFEKLNDPMIHIPVFPDAK